MSLFRKEKNEVFYVDGNKLFLNTIKNNGDADLLLFRYPEEDFNTNSVLIVNPGEEAIFIKNGEIVNVFSNGRYELSTENYPFLSRLRNALSGGVSTFNCFVYFIRKAHTMEILWGTDSPIQLRDPVQQIATTIKARGSYKIKIENSTIFLTKLLGNNIETFDQKQLKYYFVNQFQQKIKSTLTKEIKNSNEEVLGVCSEMEAFAEIITPSIREIFDEYGIKLINFSIAAMDVPQDDPNRIILESAYAKKREFDVMGNRYRTIKGVEILDNISNNPGAGGIANMGAGLGMGLAAGSVFGDMAKSVFSATQPLHGTQEDEEANSSKNNTKSQSSSQDSSQDYVEKLASLKKMLDMGLIDQSEYNSVKNSILQKMMS